MDFNVINEDFVHMYDELSELNEDASKKKTFADQASEEGIPNPEHLDALERTVARETSKASNRFLATYSGAVLPAVLGWTVLLVEAPPVAAVCAGITGASLVANAVINIIETAQYKKVTKDKLNVKLLVEQDPTLKAEIQWLINKVGKKEAEQTLAKLEKQLEEHPEILEISPEELEASRDRLTQLLQQTSVEVTGQLHETVLSDYEEEEEYSVNDYSAAEQNFCRQYLKDLPNISWLINNDELSFAVCLDELGYAKSFFDKTNAWDANKEFDFAAKSLDTWKELMLKPVEVDLVKLLPKLKQHIQSQGYEKSEEVYVVSARNIFLNGLCETLPHWNPVTESLHEAMLVDDEDEDYSVNDYSATEQNFCRQFLKDFENLSWLIENDEWSFAVCLDEVGYAKRVFSTTNAWDKEHGFGAQSLVNWKNLMLKPVEDKLARQLPKLKQHIQDNNYDKPDEVYVTAARDLFVNGLSETLPHWKD